MALAQLSIDMVAKIAEFEKDLKRATTATERQTSIMTNALKRLGAAFSVGMVVEFARRTIDSVDALNDLADATGASIENVSALEDIAARTGTTMDTVTTAMVKFNGVLKDIKPGSPSEQAFKALNLDVAELKRLDPAEALLKTATAFAGFADDGNKARIMQELFGKSLKDVAPFLKDLAEKGELVAKVTSQQAAEAEKFNKQLFDFQKNAQDASREFMGTLLPSLIKINQEIAAGIRLSGGFWNAIGVIGGSNPFNSIGENITKYRDQVEDLTASIERYKRANADTASLEQARTVAAKRLAYYKYMQAEEALLSGEQSNAETRRLGISNVKPAMPDIGGSSTPTKTPTTNKTEAQIAAEKALAAAIRDKSAAEEEFFASIIKADDQYQALLNRLLAATPTLQLEKQREDVTALTKEFEAGRISESLYLEAVTARLDLTAEKIDLVAEKTDKAKTSADEFGMTMASAFEDAIVGGKDLSTVLDGLAQDILRMTIRKAVTDPVAGYLSGAITAMLPGFAVGTDYVPRDMVARIHKGEKIIPAAQNNGSQGGAPIYVTQNFTVGDVASISMVRQAVAGSERRIAAGMGRSMNYGGALA